MNYLKIILTASALTMSCCALTLANGRVLVVHSYHQEFNWVQGINSAIEQQFASAGVSYSIFYMDTKLHPSLEWKINAGKRAKKILAQYKPEVVIAVDDNAQAYFAKYLMNSDNVQVVFCGVNAEPETYGYDTGKVTGILERAYPNQVLRLIQLIMPAVRSVAYISDDSATSDQVTPWVQNKVKNGQSPINIPIWLRPSTFTQWQKAVIELDRNPSIGALLIPLYHTVKADNAQKSLPASNVMGWTVSHTTKPVLGFWSFSVDDGALAAVVVNPREHGKTAALMARQLLGAAGKKASELPILVNKDGIVIINLKTADRLGINVPFEVLQSADKIIE